MKSATLSHFAGRLFAVFSCLVAAASLAAAGTPPEDDVATLKARVSRAEEKLQMVLRGYTVTTQENDKLKAQVSQATAACSDAVTEAGAAKARLQEVQSALDKAQQELAALRTATAGRDAENARLREILRQTQDTNAALAAENARLKTTAGVSRPSPAGSFAAPAAPAP
jgi:chromosome segregation ATPase